MKKIFTLLVMVALAACWTSCSDDDKKGNKEEDHYEKITLIVNIQDRSKEFYIPINDYFEDKGSGIIDWGDGQSEQYKAEAEVSHYYTTKGEYTITIKSNSIQSLSIYDPIISINANGCSSLKILNCTSNISTINITNCSALENFDM